MVGPACGAALINSRGLSNFCRAKIATRLSISYNTAAMQRTRTVKRRGRTGSRLNPAILIVALLLLTGLGAYYLYLGGTLSSIGMSGIFDIKFGETSKPRPVASRDFFVGRWRVDIDMPGLDVTTVIEWNADGTCSGNTKQFGVRATVACRWEFVKISDDKFRIIATYSDSDHTVNDHVFEIVDNDRIHNIDQNYMASRIK